MTPMRFVEILGGIAILWIVWAGFSYVVADPESAPQQAALAGMTLVGMVFPYTIFRIVATSRAAKQQDEIIALLKKQKPEKPKAKKLAS